MGTIQFLSAQVVRMGGGNVFNTIQAGYGASLVVQRVKNLPAMPEIQVRPLEGEDPPRTSQAMLVVKNLPDNTEDVRRGFDPWVGNIPWGSAWQPTPVFLPRKSHGQRSLVGYSPIHFSSVLWPSRVRLFATPKDCSAPGLPVHHQLPEFTQSRPLSR